MYAAGELAMTAEDLAKWNIAVIEQKVLSPASYRQLETEVLLTSGAGTRYGLGIGVQLNQSHRELSHDGEVSGFVAASTILPDDRIAVVVLTNQDAHTAADLIASQVRDVLLKAASAPSVEAERTVRRMLEELAEGRLDRSRLTANAASYFTDEAVAEYASSLRGLGALRRVEEVRSRRRGGMIGRRFRAVYDQKVLSLSVYETTDGKIEQFLATEES
jgi:CubicO group peptidase (beta-lactamase class C family)